MTLHSVLGEFLILARSISVNNYDSPESMIIHQGLIMVFVNQFLIFCTLSTTRKADAENRPPHPMQGTERRQEGVAVEAAELFWHKYVHKWSRIMVRYMMVTNDEAQGS